MKTSVTRNVIASVGVLAVSSLGAFAQDDTLVVGFAPGSPIEAILTAFGLAELAPGLGDAIETATSEVVLADLSEIPNAAELMTSLAQTPGVQWVETNGEISAPAGETQSFFVNATINDYFEQYYPPLIGVSSNSAPGTAPIIVAVLDTGVDPFHSGLRGQVLSTSGSFIQGVAQASDLPDGVDNDGDGDVDELTGHGTMMAGVVLRVAPNALILPVRVLDSDGVGSTFSVALGIQYAIDQGADVINLSLTSTEESAAIQYAIEDAVAEGIIVIACAGNAHDNDGQATVRYPAGYPMVWGIAGTDELDRKAGFSHYGEHIVLSAPSTGIVSTLPGDRYAFANGTSLATAMVAGLTARVLAVEPMTTPADLLDMLSAEALPINPAPLSAGDPVDPAVITLMGAGRISALGLPGSLATCAELNGDGVVDVLDLIGFLQLWFQGDLEADLTGGAYSQSSIVDTDDLLQYLQCWFSVGKL